MLDARSRSANGFALRCLVRANPFTQQLARTCKAATLPTTLGLLLALSACGPVALSVTSPPGKSPAAAQYEDAACTRASNNVPQLYAQCMERLGYRVQLLTPGGTASMNTAYQQVSSIPPALSPPPQQAVIPHMAAPPAPPLPPSQESLKYARLLDRLVSDDSRSWAMNQYLPGSMQNVTIEQEDGSHKLVKGYYSYNDGKGGWVEARFVGSRLSCLHYWDRTDCRQLGEGAGKQMERAAEEERRHPRPVQPASGTKPDPWGSALCNKALGTSAWNIMSPCN